MTILTSRDLHECGICLTDKREEADLLRSVNDALELRVGTALARRLRPEQLRAFMSLTDERAQIRWLAQHIPDYEAVVYDCIASIRGELKKMADLPPSERDPPGRRFFRKPPGDAI